MNPKYKCDRLIIDAQGVRSASTQGSDRAPPPIHSDTPPTARSKSICWKSDIFVSRAKPSFQSSYD